MANNEQNLIPVQSKEEARERGRAGGIASGKARRERKTIAEVLRAELDKPANETGLTKREYLVAKCISNLKDDISVKELRTLCDVLGELHINLDVQGDGKVIVVRSEEEARKIENIGNIGA